MERARSTTPDVEMPTEFEPRRLARRTLQIVAVLAVVGLVLLLAPGLGQVRDLLTHAHPGVGGAGRRCSRPCRASPTW